MTLYYLKLTGVKVARLDIFGKRLAHLGVCDSSATPRRRRETNLEKKHRKVFIFLHSLSVNYLKINTLMFYLTKIGICAIMNIVTY